MEVQERQDGNQLSALPAVGMSFLILIQVVSRLLTFASNQLVLRHMSPEILGVAAHLELYSITVLYFSRECLRTAIQREPPAGSVMTTPDRRTSVDNVRPSPATASQTVINMSYLAMILGIPLTGLFALCYCRWATDEIFQTPSFVPSLEIVGFACLLELATEPFFAIVQHRMLYKERAVVETTAAVAKSLIICATAVWAARVKWNAGVLPFALGYLAYASTLLCVYIWQMLGKSTSRDFSFWLTPIHSR
jgi:oligosaccharide translocation protein RFT1